MLVALQMLILTAGELQIRLNGDEKSGIPCTCVLWGFRYLCKS